jgi:beta-lactamase class A
MIASISLPLLHILNFFFFSPTFFLVNMAYPAPEPVVVEAPVTTPVKQIKALEECMNQELQEALEKVLNKNATFRKLINNKKLAVGMVDMRDEYNAKLAMVNGREMMYAASLPKIAILFATMDAIEKGELKETKAIKNDMRLMIAVSDNHASTRLIDRLGYKKIEAVLTDPRYALYDESRGGGLWVGKRYASGGARYPDPLKGLTHAATVEQVCRYYYMMANGQLVSEERSKQMMEIMTDPELHHKFVNTLDKIAPNAQLYRKSGSWGNFHSDSVMVKGNGRNYILTALAEDPDGEQIIRDLVYAVEKAMEMVE